MGLVVLVVERSYFCDCAVVKLEYDPHCATTLRPCRELSSRWGMKSSRLKFLGRFQESHLQKTLEISFHHLPEISQVCVLWRRARVITCLRWQGLTLGLEIWEMVWKIFHIWFLMFYLNRDTSVVALFGHRISFKKTKTKKTILSEVFVDPFTWSWNWNCLSIVGLLHKEPRLPGIFI